MKKLQKMSSASVSKLSRNELKTIMGGYGGNGSGNKCCKDGKCSSCVTDGALVCTGGSTLTSC